MGIMRKQNIYNMPSGFTNIEDVYRVYKNKKENENKSIKVKHNVKNSIHNFPEIALELKNKYDEGIFENWFEKSTFEIIDNVLIVKSISKFKKEWVENKYGDDIKLYFHKHVNKRLEVKFSIDKKILTE